MQCVRTHTHTPRKTLPGRPRGKPAARLIVGLQDFPSLTDISAHPCLFSPPCIGSFSIRAPLAHAGVQLLARHGRRRWRISVSDLAPRHSAVLLLQRVPGGPPPITGSVPISDYSWKGEAALSPESPVQTHPPPGSILKMW